MTPAQYSVDFTLKDGVEKKLIEACGDAPWRVLTVYINGRWYGASDFNKAQPKKFYPPGTGYTLSKEEAERILKASQRREAPDPSPAEPSAAANSGARLESWPCR